ncbi:unnamed protein product [Bursaphelenchus xylophilus]|uniref:(pine wood nematode) hypothetical protein n=1 Tax=Bursaphelenchus xylophilus TaxID=6326 RepID=A0A1I7SCY5_BURXY|nr:unnamed protein product [Bursaphelenchus xylophilus]CAG9093250.1 unnamed protein product [Bursaphelenchus xylophilus]
MTTDPAYVEKCRKDLAKRWNDLTSFVSDAIREKWWAMIDERYAPRPFHGLAHLEHMMQLFDTHKDLLKDRYAVAFAIFFKHLEYDPLNAEEAERNEERLREFAAETTFDQANYVSRLLLESANNCTDAHLNPDKYGDDDLHYLIDFDTAWMGVGEAEYTKFREAARSEVGNLNDKDYIERRLKVLELFLQIPNIFATKVMRDIYEAQARKNIKDEIEFLNGLSKG